MVRKEVLFDENFFGWKFGPVLKSVRKEYSKSNPFESVKDALSLEAMTLVLEVFNRYAEVSSWKLSRLSHNEFSWQCARKGLRADDNGDVPLKVSAMRMDAARELAFRNNTEE